MEIAKNVATNNNFAGGIGLSEGSGPNTIRAPLYPALLAVIYYIKGGDIYGTVRILQSILSAMTCVIIFMLTRKTWGDKMGIVAGMVAVFTPDLVVYSAYLLTETLYMFLVALLLYCAYKFSDRLVGLIMAGVLLGLAALARPGILIFLPFVFLWLYFRKNVKIHKLILIPLITVIIITPWTIRNYAVSGSVAIVSSAGPINLWIGNNENGTGEFHWIEEGNPRLEPGLSEAEISYRCYREVIRFFINKPLKALGLVLLKAILFVIPTGDKSYFVGNYLQPVAMFFITGIFFEFLLLGVVLVPFYERKRGTSLYWLYIGYVICTVLVFWFLERYRVTAYLTIIPLAVVGYYYLFRKGDIKWKITVIVSTLVIQVALGITALALRPGYIEAAQRLLF